MSGGAMMIAAAAAQSAVGVISGLLLARWLGPDIFGHFAVVITIVGLTLTVLSLRPSFLIIRVPESELTPRLREVYATALIIETGVAALIAAASLAWLGMLDRFSIVALVGQSLAHWISHNRTFYERAMPYRQLAIIETTAAVSGHIVVIALAAAGAGPMSLYLRDAVSALGLVLALTPVRGVFWHPIRWLTVSEWRRLLREATVPWIDGVLEGGFQRLTILVASSLGTPREIGLFFVAQSLAMRPQQLLAPVTARIAGNWFSRLSDHRQRIRDRDRLILFVAGPLLVLAIAMAAAADWLVPLILGSAWSDAAPIVVALSGVVLFATLFELGRSFNLVLNNLKVLVVARSSQYAALVMITGAALMVGIEPMVVVGLAVSASFAVAFVVQLFLLKSAEKR